MANPRTSGPRAWLSRLTAALTGHAPFTATNPSVRMPDLEVWKMPHRQVDMKDWEVALNMANNRFRPDRSKLMDLYDSLLMDAHLASVMESRVLRVVRSRWRLVGADGKPRPDLAPHLEQAWFEDFLRYAAEAVPRGHTVIELGELAAPGQLRQVNRIDPRNVLPWTGHIVRRRGDQKGYPFREEPLRNYLIEVGRPEELGYLHDVAPVVIIKKFAAGSWSAYVDIFGVPFRWVTSDTTDRRRMEQLQEVMRLSLSMNYGVLQGNEKIEVMPTPAGDPHKVFDELISRMNSEISKRVLGQDGTSDNKDASGTYGSLQVLQGVAEDRHQADKSAVRYLVNNELLPRLVLLGYPLAGVRFEWDQLRDLGSMELVDAVAKLGAVFEVDPEYVAERTGIKITGIRRMPGEVSDDAPGGTGRQSGKKKGERSEEETDDDDDEDGATASWPQDIIALCAHCGGTRDVTAESTPEIAQAALEQMLADVHAGAAWSQPYFEETAKVLGDGLLQTWRHDLDQVQYHAADHVARAAMEANLFRFSAAKTLSLALDLNHHVSESTGLADFKRRVDESGLMGQYNRQYLDAEYVNAVNTGIQASRWYQMQRSSDALPYGQYYTAGDSQVRPAHAALDGKVWPLTDPIWRKIWPPNGWKCRCSVLPVTDGPQGDTLKGQTREAFDALDLSGELERMKKGGFDRNRAITGEVFDLNKSYRDQLGTAAGKTPTFGVRDSYGADAKKVSWEAMHKAGLPAITSTTAKPYDAERWYQRNKNAEGVVVIKDHAGKPVRFEGSTMQKKLRKEAGRASLVDQVPGVIAKPDEVWLDERGDFVYLRFTDQGAIRVPVRLDKSGGLRIRSFYLDTDDIDKQRAGLLVKKHVAQ